jgi:hypothetical protein
MYALECSTVQSKESLFSVRTSEESFVSGSQLARHKELGRRRDGGFRLDNTSYQSMFVDFVV